MKYIVIWPILAVLLLSPACWAQRIISPAEHLGHAVGEDFKLPGWKLVSDYYRQLAHQSSRVRLETAGKTTEGRDFLVATISSEENLERLDEIKRFARQIADPRGLDPTEKRRAIMRGSVVLFITPSMHSTEVAATQMAMEFAWLLATADGEPWRTARQTTVVVLTPTLNPDGLDHVSEWYHKTVRTPYEGSSLPKLYHYYVGHDNNRDWFMLTQSETKHLSRLIYREWFPQILWDVHQQGNAEERMFVPPFKDPLNPNIEPLTVAGVNLLGNRAVLDMTRDGLRGIATGVSYDNWYVGGNRNVPTRHHIVGLLTEAASANLASPVFQPASSLKNPLGKGKYDRSNQFVAPWPGGWWRVRDIIDYEMAFGRSLLGSINREPQMWLANAMQSAERSIERAQDGPKAWLIPPDNLDRSAVRRLIEALLGTGVEVHVSRAPLIADGREYPTGTIVLRAEQPYGSYVKDLFELQQFPPDERPYDTCGWTLPLLLGVRRIEVIGPLQGDLQRADTAEEALAGFRGDRRTWETGGALVTAGDADSWTDVSRQLEARRPVQFFTAGPAAGLFDLRATTSDAQGHMSLWIDRLPRIGVYSPWSGSMDEGWLRWTLDYFRVPFITVRNETLRAGNLHELFDVLVIPDLASRTLDQGRESGTVPSEFTGGLAPEGELAVETFVREGGRLVAWGDACSWVVDEFRLPLVEVTGESSAKGFLCPGSALRGVTESHPLTAGLPHDMAVFFNDSQAWREMTKAELEKTDRKPGRLRTLLRYAPNRLLLSGKIDRPEVIEGKSAWVATQHGKGTLHLIGFSPHFRAWTQQTMHILFRALILPGTP